MPLSTAIKSYRCRKLEALYPGKARTDCVNLAPSTVFPAGTVLGQAASTANDVQALTVTGTPTGGSLTIGFTDPITGVASTFIVPFDSSTAANQVLARAAIGNSDIAVSGSGVLPGNVHSYTLSGRYAGRPAPLMTIVTNGLTGGTNSAGAITRTTEGRTAGTFDVYVDAGAYDPARCILMNDCATDSGGNITLGTTATGGEHGETTQDTPVYIEGEFATADLVGLDAGAVADLKGRLSDGTLSAGTFTF